ncbi:MAG: glycosyltransferase [Thermoleophilaceae bacterium]|nr:glycosyltransferase [Thermoleophilaceae bacterium]
MSAGGPGPFADLTLLVIAKEPRPGLSKTRLSPPCSPEEAAALAEAALHDTLESVAAVPAARRVLVLEGRPGPWLPAGYEVVPQRAGGLDERLAGAFAAATGPAFLVGMDTPQVTPALIEASASALAGPEVDAVLGRAEDGGYWAIGLVRPDERAFRGVPMSVETTGEAQRARLDELGLRTEELPVLRDVDFFEDARAVASEAPDSRFARAVGAVGVPT